jgi:hypothetical protein
MKLYLFLRSIVWTSVLSAAAIIATLIAAFTIPQMVLPFGLSSIALAVLSQSRDR